MTDFEDDELLSAYLDGEATPDEVAHVEADPALVAEAARLGALRSRLDIGDPPPEMADGHIAAAMAEFGQREGADAGAGGATAPAGVADLGTRRRSLLERIPLGAVAAVVVVLALVGAATQLDFESDDDTATADFSEDADTGDAATSAEPSEDADGAGGDGDDETFSDVSEEAGRLEDAASAADAAAGRGVLAFSDTDGLADFVTSSYDDIARDGFAADELDSAGDSTTSTAAAPQQQDPASAVLACDPVSAAGVDPDQVTVVLPAVVAGDQVTAVVTEDANGSRRLSVVAGADCTVIDDRQF